MPKISTSFSALLLLGLSGCQTPIPTIVTPKGKTPNVCLLWKEQSYSAKADSELTIAEVRQRNAERNAYCQKRT